jgi:hypothetical protein
LKDFYLQHYPEIEPAFKWRSRTIPPTSKPHSIANLIALEVSLLGALTTASAAYFLLLAFGGVGWWAWLAIGFAFLAGYGVLWATYKNLLVDDR